MKVIQRATRYVKNNGLKRGVIRLFEKMTEASSAKERNKLQQESYMKWIEANEPTSKELELQRKHKFDFMPKISVVVPMYNTKERYFRELVESLQNQTYSNFELCLADGSEKKASYIDEIISGDDMIKYKHLEENKLIAGNTNEGIKMATGQYVALLDHDDILPPFSLFEVVSAINENKDADFIYSDEDKLMEYKDKRMGPHFKPDFAIDTFRSYNYICHFSIFKKELLDKINGFSLDYNGSQDYDIFLRMSEVANKIVHIPKILYHWRINELSVASSASAKPYAYVAAKKAISDSLKRKNIDADVVDSRILGLYRVIYKVKGTPKVSIIIPNKDHVSDLKKCIKSILKSTYENYEIVIVENNSEKKATFDYYEKLKQNEKIKIVTYEKEGFNYSEINNFGVRNSNGEYVLFLNNDISIISNDFLYTMIGDCQRDDIAVVGAKLLYPDGTIQHAGIVLNYTGIAGHVNAHLKGSDEGYMGRTMIQQNFNAVTAAMMMVKRSDFYRVDGFDEELKVAYNDIDFCLKLREMGKLVMYDPYVEAYHYESKTRGYEDTIEKKERLEKEAKLLKSKHKKMFDKEDEYFNINFRHDVPDMRIREDKVAK